MWIRQQYRQHLFGQYSVFQSIFVSSIGITNACKDTLRTHNLTTSSRKMRDNTKKTGRKRSLLQWLLPSVQRWLTSSFRPVPELTAPRRYRFDTSGAFTVQQDVVVSQDGMRL